MRASGILLPIASLPSEYGIGAFNKYAYEFVDKLVRAGQTFWQILPLGPTGYGDSPYQSFSAYAGNPYFIDIDDLCKKRLLTKEECTEVDFSENESYVSYEKVYFSRFELLKKAFMRFDRSNLEYLGFLARTKKWLPNYALFMAIKKAHGGAPFCDWEESIRIRESETIKLFQEKWAEEIEFNYFMQYFFEKEWVELKTYANQLGIKIIGDIPIYVAYDSADTWANTELFRLDEQLLPIEVAGCPPDSFAKTGQLWGNPLYNWEYHKVTGYSWWKERMEHSFSLYDVVRVDHFRGFDAYYSISYGDKTAEYGTWKEGPGIELFREMEASLGRLNIIAEDLGYQTKSVQKMLTESGYPGMKVLQFAFDSRENANYFPHTYEKNSVVYTGTHDNDTLLGWYRNIATKDREIVNAYLDLDGKSETEAVWKVIRQGLSSVADLCIIPIQDYLVKDSSARINTPSTLGENWKWRIKKDELSDELCDKIKRVTKIYMR